MKTAERRKRIQELRKELITLEVEEQYEEGWIDEAYTEADLKEIAAIAYILYDELDDPIRNALEIKEGTRMLTDSGRKRIEEELNK